MSSSRAMSSASSPDDASMVRKPCGSMMSRRASRQPRSSSVIRIEYGRSEVAFIPLYLIRPGSRVAQSPSRGGDGLHRIWGEEQIMYRDVVRLRPVL